MKSFDTLKQMISVIEFATANGYAIDTKAGIKYPVLKHPSGDKIIVIDAHKTTQGYFNPCNDNDKGSLIDFVQNRLGWLFTKNASKSELVNVSIILHTYLNLPSEMRSYYQMPVIFVQKGFEAKTKEATFSTAGLKPLTDFSYLQRRCISSDTLGSDLFKGRVFNHPASDFKNNTGFIYTDKDDTITGIEVCNTNFKKFMPGSDRSYSIWRSNMPATLGRVLFFESAIDALSYYELKQNIHALYIAFGGQLAEGQLQTAKNIIEKLTAGKDVKMFSCFDNDMAGEKFTKKLEEWFTIDRWLLPEIGKDFNEWLQMSKNKISSGFII